MRQKRILFFDGENDTILQKVVHRAIVSAGSSIEVLEDVAQAKERLKNADFDLVLVNYDSENELTHDFASQRLSEVGGASTILVSQKRDKQHLINLFSHEKLRNLIARNGQVSEEELIITTEKILRKDIFGLEKYLVWGISLVQEVIADSSEKDDQVERVGEYVKSLKCDKRFVRLAQVVADELIMNALYDAPVDESGKPLYTHLPRSERVKLEPKDRAILEYGSDGRFFAIACRDRFGALKAETVVQYLKKCFAQDEYQVDPTKGGAGVGFFMIFQSLNQLVVNIEPGRMTETIGLVDIRATYRDTKSRSKSFNIFIRD